MGGTGDRGCALRRGGKGGARAPGTDLFARTYYARIGLCRTLQRLPRHAGQFRAGRYSGLRDRVGYFMCSPEGRDYLIRLPNVAYSAITDNQELANMMNFVVFGLGGASAPKGAKPFTSAEVARLRTRAFATQSLISAREQIVGKLVGTCSVPESMKFFYDPQTQAAR
jgi:hypothetical protein